MADETNSILVADIGSVHTRLVLTIWSRVSTG
jgi:hypothetical protein